VKLKGAFTDHLASVESEQVFVPFIGGEAERIERCAVAAKRCLGVGAGVALDPWAAAANVDVNVRGEEFFAALPKDERRQVLEIGGHCWSAGTIKISPSQPAARPIACTHAVSESASGSATL